MKCSICLDLLDDYLRGYIDQLLAMKISDHLVVCNKCAAEYESHKDLLTILEREPEPIVDKDELTDFLPGVWQKIEAKRSTPWTGWLFKLVPPVVAALILSIIILNPFVEFAPYQSEISSEEVIFSESGYYALIDKVFSDEETETLDFIESELYSNKYLYSNGDYNKYLEEFDDEGLSLFEERLDELFNNTG